MKSKLDFRTEKQARDHAIALRKIWICKECQSIAGARREHGSLRWGERPHSLRDSRQCVRLWVGRDFIESFVHHPIAPHHRRGKRIPTV